MQTALKIITLYKIDKPFNAGMPMLPLSPSTENSRA